MKYSDLDIINNIRNGKSNDVIKYLYQQTYPKVRSMVLKRGGNIDNAKDVFQDAIIITVQYILEQKYKDENFNVEAFIYSVALRKLIDFFRKNSKMDFKEDYQALENINYHDDTSLLTKERQIAIDEILGSVGERCKEILSLVILNNYSMKEIAETLGFSNEDSAKTQHYKCRQKLIKKYQDNENIKTLLVGDH